MSFTFFLWIFSASLLVSLLFSTLSYSLRSFSRVELEEYLTARRRREHSMRS